MDFSKKYMVFWSLVFLVAVLADVFDVFGMLEIEGSSFVYGLLAGFVIMKFAPDVKDNSEKKE